MSADNPIYLHHILVNFGPNFEMRRHAKSNNGSPDAARGE